jgi:Domain of unknown function (DUF3943)
MNKTGLCAKYWLLLVGTFILTLTMPHAGFAADTVSIKLDTAKLEIDEGKDADKDNLVFASSKAEADEGDKEHPGPTLKDQWGVGIHKSYLIPALEIPGFIVLLNAYDRVAYPNEEENGKKIYSSTPKTFWKHLTQGPWVLDNDSFNMNQFLHPYAGTVYFGFARSAGLNYWESSAYTFAGGFLWEMAGETTRPSINDQIASGIAGAFLGEPLFRMASLLLESKPGGFFHELGAAIISPPTGFNRLVFGERFKPVFPSFDPAYFWQLRVGQSLNSRLSGQDSSGTFRKYVNSVNFSMAYGLPGKTGYEYTRPFDYFQFDATASNGAGTYFENIFENIMARGLLLGNRYESGDAYRGIWGLYGSYDYISPRNFRSLRVSTTAVSIGNTAQWWLSRDVALQGSALAGIGYGAAGGNVPGQGNRDYHYGVSPQGLLDLRLIIGSAAMFDATGRGYYVSDLGATKPAGTETIGRASTGLTVRVYGRNALAIQYMITGRDARYNGQSSIHQHASTVTLLYTLLSDKHFGAVEWR